MQLSGGEKFQECSKKEGVALETSNTWRRPENENQAVWASKEKARRKKCDVRDSFAHQSFRNVT